MIEYMGNKALLEREMTAFLAPSRVSPLAVLPTLDWASEMSRGGNVVVSGFSSRMEKEVWNVLSRGSSPIVKVMVQSRYKRTPRDVQPLLDSGRLLIVFLGIAPRLNRQNAAKRNTCVASLARHIVFPSMNQHSSLHTLYLQLLADGRQPRLLHR